MDCLGNFLDGFPVDKDSVLAVGCPLAEFIVVHPAAYLFHIFYTQFSIDLSVVAERWSVQLLDSNRVCLLWLAEGEDDVAPHLHLALSSVHILLDCVEEWPWMILWQLEWSVDHFLSFSIYLISLLDLSFCTGFWGFGPRWSHWPYIDRWNEACLQHLALDDDCMGLDLHSRARRWQLSNRCDWNTRSHSFL